MEFKRWQPSKGAEVLEVKRCEAGKDRYLVCDISISVFGAAISNVKTNDACHTTSVFFIGFIVF